MGLLLPTQNKKLKTCEEHNQEPEKFEKSMKSGAGGEDVSMKWFSARFRFFVGNESIYNQNLNKVTDLFLIM